ncbi:MAG TPA: Ig-like domain-containing protein [Actinophytocola sp.]|nr:Ig-like domain-containing protein [Actinophytocola sp.]
MTWRNLLAGCLAATLVLTACSSDDEPSTPDSQEERAPEPRIVTVPADDAANVSPIEPVEVRVRDGELDDVAVTNPAGKLVEGTLSEDGTTWRSAEPLGYARDYTITAVASGDGGKADSKTTFTTLSPQQTVFPSFFPPPGKPARVGVGQPIAVIFDKPPADREAAEKALRVTATPATQGGWYWWDDRTVHWRPRVYWKPGTKVTVDAKIYGVRLGEGMYGETDRTLNLTIGPAKIATIDDRTHRMVVTVNGRKVKTFPVSMGRPGAVTVKGKRISFRTPSGTYVAQEKYPVKRMNSGSYGLPSNASLGYDEKIPLAVRISNSGIFVHAAPWSVADQGRRNVSHGCINLSPAAGRWFYDHFSYGDIVTIRGTGTRLHPTDGFGDWNIPWPKWREGSALN